MQLPPLKDYLLKAALIASILLVQGCAIPPRTPPHPAAARPCDNCLPGVQNFARVSPVLWRGAQPTREGFRELERNGVTTVISLRIGEDNSDAPLLSGTGLRYVQIPMKAWHPEKDKLKRFLQEVDHVRRQGRGSVFVHCQQGRDRTGYAVAAYRMVMEGWTADQAIAEMFDFRFNRLWRGNPGFIRELGVDEIKPSGETAN
ncbi:MAG TPA: dual specificity protein phosphatase family protein [Fluviicoccus sp.]|nr:dual specificity protein phosphatase family protein [Fluviicoccus sp.]